jgi:methyl-accepting chemotaxis protein
VWLAKFVLCAVENKTNCWQMCADASGTSACSCKLLAFCVLINHMLTRHVAWHTLQDLREQLAQLQLEVDSFTSVASNAAQQSRDLAEQLPQLRLDVQQATAAAQQGQVAADAVTQLLESSETATALQQATQASAAVTQLQQQLQQVTAAAARQAEDTSAGMRELQEAVQQAQAAAQAAAQSAPELREQAAAAAKAADEAAAGVAQIRSELHQAVADASDMRSELQQAAQKAAEAAEHVHLLKQQELLCPATQAADDTTVHKLEVSIVCCWVWCYNRVGGGCQASLVVQVSFRCACCGVCWLMCV